MEFLGNVFNNFIFEKFLSHEVPVTQELQPGAELGVCQGGPLPHQNFARLPQWPPKIFLFLKVLNRPLKAPLVAKLAPPVASPNENVWLRP